MYLYLEGGGFNKPCLWGADTALLPVCIIQLMCAGVVMVEGLFLLWNKVCKPIRRRPALFNWLHCNFDMGSSCM